MTAADVSELTGVQLRCLGRAIGEGFAESSGCKPYGDGSGGLGNAIESALAEANRHLGDIATAAKTIAGRIGR